MLIVDFSYMGKINPIFLEQFESLSNKLRKPFTDMISDISIKMGDNIDWWMSGPPSRNTNASPLFHYYCVIHMVEEIKQKEIEISEILVDSIALYNIIKKSLHKSNKKIKVRYKTIALVHKLFFFFFIFYLSLEEILKFILKKKYSYKTQYLDKSLLLQELTLVDIWITKEFISSDRYYGLFWDNLKDEQKSKLFFVPTFVNIPIIKYSAVFKELHSSTKNYIIKENYLKLKDMVYALGHFFRVKKIKINPINVLGFNLVPIIKEELRSYKGYRNSINGILNYRFSRRLAEKRIKLKLIIDWFENQIIDKGWNRGFNEHYPDTKTIGYMGFSLPMQYLCVFPTKVENQHKLLPSVIKVIGKKFINTVKEFDSELKVETAPAFRFQHLWQEKKMKPDAKYKTILIALTNDLNNSIVILKNIRDFLLNNDSTEYKYWIKSHPILKFEEIKKVWDLPWPNKFVILNKNIEELIPKCDILVTGMSSIALEAISLAKPLIIINNHGLTFNTIPDGIPDILWKSCTNYKDTESAIKYFLNIDKNTKKNHIKLAERIKNEYFVPVTEKTIKQFIN